MGAATFKSTLCRPKRSRVAHFSSVALVLIIILIIYRFRVFGRNGISFASERYSRESSAMQTQRKLGGPIIPGSKFYMTT